MSKKLGALVAVLSVVNTILLLAILYLDTTREEAARLSIDELADTIAEISEMM